VYGVARALSLLGAIVAACLYGPAALAQLRLDDAALLAGAFAVAGALGLLRAPNAHFERSARPTPDSDRVGLLVPVLLVLLVQEGWIWAAACNVFAFLVRRRSRRRPGFDRVLTAALRFPGWWAAAVAAGSLRAEIAAPPGPLALGAFVVGTAVLVLAIDLLWIDSLLAARQSRSLLTVWSRHVNDAATLGTILAEGGWAYLVARLAFAHQPFLALIALLPLVIVAALLARLARVNARLYRLTLSRDAVDAMLRASDPEPQVRSLLESVDARIGRESVEVAVFGRSGADRWSRLVRLGPPVPPELERLGGRALLELQVTGDDMTLERPQGAVCAFAARDALGGLRGALLVFRVAGAATHVAARDFERAARELGPLLGEYVSIAATRSAASIDTLTGLPNRRGVSRALDEAMVHVRGGGRFALLLLDIDHFKSVNDLLGHQTGDRALARIGRVIAENTRGVDVAGRFGGEEFLVLLRDASRERALGVAERLRAAIEAGGVAYADGKPVTISIGVAYARPGDASSDVLERADRALYRAKNAGRNRVVESSLVAAG
jgi:diguanylate cyclase (GGDEF)-like protein